MDKEVYTSLLEDMLDDFREQRRFLKTVLASMIAVVFLVLTGAFALSIYNQTLLKNSAAETTQRIFDFITGAEFNTSIEMNTDNNSSAENVSIR